MRLTKRATRDQFTTPNREHLSDGIGGTITGGPMEPIGLLDILERGAPGASHGGAVSGAAQVVAGKPRGPRLAEPGIALSDGSRICFASFADADPVREDDAPMANSARAPVPKDGKAPMPRDGKPRAGADDKIRTHRTGVLAAV